MKRIALLSLLALFTTTLLFAHAGEVHTYLGTITQINEDGSFVIEMTSGKDRTVLVSEETTYAHANGREAKPSELSIGRRVATKISEDGKTALNVKLGAAKNSEGKK